MPQSTVAHTATIVSAYVSNNHVLAADIPNLIDTVCNAITNIMNPSAEPDDRGILKPAVLVRKSVTSEYIVCLEDGKKCKMLKRHLMASFKMTPDQYRTKWGLPSDYPMTAPAYSARRSEFAKTFGLGARNRKKVA